MTPVEMLRVGDGEERLATLRRTVCRLLTLLDNCDRDHPLEWHAKVREQVLEIERQYPTRSLR